MTIKKRVEKIEVKYKKTSRGPTWRDLITGRYIPPGWDDFMRSVYDERTDRTTDRNPAGFSLPKV